MNPGQHHKLPYVPLTYFLQSKLTGIVQIKNSRTTERCEVDLKYSRCCRRIERLTVSKAFERSRKDTAERCLVETRLLYRVHIAWIVESVQKPN